MIPLCDHHGHDGIVTDADWTASISGEEIGSWCGDHLGEALSDFDGTVTLTRVEDW